MPNHLARIALNHRRATLILIGSACVLLAAGLPRLTTAVGYRAFLGTHHESVQELDTLLARFGGGLPLAAVWTCDGTACVSALDPRSLAMASAVATRMQAVDGVRRVDSPATSPLMVQPLFGLPEARRLTANGKPAADLGELESVALDDPMWRGQLISGDGRTGAILVHLFDSSGIASTEVFNALVRTLEAHEAKGFRFSLVGGPVEFVVAGAELERNTKRIMPLMVALIAAILLWVFRSTVATLAALGTIAFAVLGTFGAMGWLHWEANTFTQALAPLLLVIGVCDAVHLLSRYIAQPAELPRREALLRACDEVGAPCFMTSLTTAAGFGSLVVSPLESLARFGALALFGVMLALLLTFTLLPIVISYIPRNVLSRTTAHARLEAAIVGVATWSQRHRAITLTAVLLCSLLALNGLRFLELEARFEDLYGENSQVVRWAHAVSSTLRPPDTLEIAIEPSPEAKETPQAFATLSRLQARLGETQGLALTRSVLDPMRRLNGMLHRDGLDLAPGEAAQERVSSLLRLLRSQDADLIALFLHRETGAMRISAAAEKLPQTELRQMLATVRQAIAEHLPPGWSATVTGPVALVQELIDEIRSTQLESFALAAVLVFGMVTFFFRSIAYAGLATVPTLLPVLLTLGAMGATGIALDIGSAMVATVVVGIAVDDAIHLLAQYRRQRSEGAEIGAACREAVRHTGRALTTSSVAMTLGFFTLLLSPWKSIASFGLLAGVAIASALVATIVVLPAILSREQMGADAAGIGGEPLKRSL